MVLFPATQKYSDKDLGLKLTVEMTEKNKFKRDFESIISHCKQDKNPNCRV